MLAVFQAALSSSAQVPLKDVVIKGTIVDFSGAPVKAATVGIAAHDRKPVVIAATRSDGSGQFSLKAQVSGECELTIHADGFRNAVIALRISAAKPEPHRGRSSILTH
jgi:hypothetical protein